tara:strand:+ start:238 stop:432 length:195 start_codon:yes stop_codon:yes gene_type:complete
MQKPIQAEIYLNRKDSLMQVIKDIVVLICHRRKQALLKPSIESSINYCFKLLIKQFIKCSKVVY